MSRVTDPVRLADTGPVRLSAAAERVAARAGLSPADALSLTMRATPVDRTETPERWRARSRSSGWDLSLQVVREHGTAVVVALTARPQRHGAGSEERRRERRAEAYRGPGRPALPEEDARTVGVEVRMSPREVADLDAHAARLGVGRSEAVRRAVVAAAATTRRGGPTR